MAVDDLDSGKSLGAEQVRCLPALLETIVPASEDGTMPSAAEMDFISYINMQAPEFMATLVEIIDQLGDDYSRQTLPARVTRIQEFSQADAEGFKELVFRIYDCYYQNDRVRRLIGAQIGPPFPSGHTIPAGDLSSLEAVKARGKGYRR